MAEQKKHIDNLPPVTLPMTGDELIPVSQAGVVKVMKPGDFPAVVDGFVKIDGTTPFGGNQSMDGHRLTDLAAAIEDNDAVRKLELVKRTSWKALEW